MAMKFGEGLGFGLLHVAFTGIRETRLFCGRDGSLKALRKSIRQPPADPGQSCRDSTAFCTSGPWKRELFEHSQGQHHEHQPSMHHEHQPSAFSHQGPVDVILEHR